MIVKFRAFQIRAGTNGEWIPVPEGWWVNQELESATSCDGKIVAYMNPRTWPRPNQFNNYFPPSNNSSYVDLSFEDGTSIPSVDERQLEFLEE